MRRRTGVLTAFAAAVVISLAGSGAQGSYCYSNSGDTQYDPDNNVERWTTVDIDFRPGGGGGGKGSTQGQGTMNVWKICVLDSPDD